MRAARLGLALSDRLLNWPETPGGSIAEEPTLLSEIPCAQMLRVFPSLRATLSLRRPTPAFSRSKGTPQKIARSTGFSRNVSATKPFRLKAVLRALNDFYENTRPGRRYGTGSVHFRPRRPITQPTFTLNSDPPAAPWRLSNPPCQSLP